MTKTTRTFRTESRTDSSTWMQAGETRKTLNGALGDLEFFVNRHRSDMPTTHYRVVNSEGQILANRTA